MQPFPGLTYAFGPFELEPADRRLLRAGEPVPVSPKAFDVLVVLVERAGRLVTKEELLGAVWPDLVVEDNTLSVTVSRLRALLADEGRRGRYIETVTGHGYRFVAPVAAHAAPLALSLDGDSTAGGQRIEDVVPALAPLVSHGGDGAAPPAPVAAPAQAPAPPAVPAAPARRRPRPSGVPLLAGTGAVMLLALLFLAAPERPATPPAPAVPATHQSPPEALLAYRRARALWESRGLDAMGYALAEFKLAAHLDPTFARAYLGQAQVYALGYGMEAEAEAAIDRALALDSTLAEAWATRAFVRAYQRWDWSGAEAAFARATALDPDDVTTLQWLANLRMVQRRLPEAEAALRRAIALRPDYANLHADLCEALYYRRAYADALAACDRALALDPIHPFAWSHRFWVLLAMPDRRAESARTFLGDPDLGPMHHRGFEADPALVARADVEGLLQGLLAASEAEPSTMDAHFRARLHARLGHREAALAAVERAAAERQFQAPFLNPNPVFDAYRGDPRWVAAMRRIGLE